MPAGKFKQAGFSYLFTLMLIALIGMGLAAAGTVWRTDMQRAREAELLFIGDQYRQAIRSYYELDPATPRLPQSIDELLEDDRRPTSVRHLRRAYPDPFTGQKLALILEPETQGIVGVHSQSTAQPLKTAGFTPGHEAFAGAGSFSEWRFEFIPPVVPASEAKPSRGNAQPSGIKPGE